jgi:hypothetical protein
VLTQTIHAVRLTWLVRAAVRRIMFDTGHFVASDGLYLVDVGHAAN